MVTPFSYQTRKTLERGRHIREVLKQPRYERMPAPEQIAILLAITAGILDDIPLDEISFAKKMIGKAFSEGLPELYQRILSAGKLSSDDKEKILNISRIALKK